MVVAVIGPGGDFAFEGGFVRDATIQTLSGGSSLKGVGKSQFGGGSAVAQGGSRLA